jgi:hypothetical protein
MLDENSVAGFRAEFSLHRHQNRMGRKILISLFVIITSAQIAAAQAPDCKSIMGSKTRLACYDKISPPESRPNERWVGRNRMIRFRPPTAAPMCGSKEFAVVARGPSDQ